MTVSVLGTFSFLDMSKKKKKKLFKIEFYVGAIYPDFDSKIRTIAVI